MFPASSHDGIDVIVSVAWTVHSATTDHVDCRLLACQAPVRTLTAIAEQLQRTVTMLS